MVEFWYVEDFIGIEISRVVLIDLFEPSIQFLNLLFAKLAWKLGIPHLNNNYTLG